jgi:hypothetical protein
LIFFINHLLANQPEQSNTGRIKISLPSARNSHRHSGSKIRKP